MPDAMQKLSAEQQLDVAIRSAARDADPKMPSREVARVFYESNRGCVEPFVSRIVVEYLTRTIGRHRAKLRRERNPQLAWEEILGVRHLPPKLKAKNGKSVERGDATIGWYRKLVVKLGDVDVPARLAAIQVVELMAKYLPRQPKITWAKVAELEARKAVTNKR